MNKVIGMLLLLVVFSIGFASFSFAHANELNQMDAVSYKVKKGDMLRLISLKYYGTELKAKFLAKANGIKNPDLIFAGSTIKIPNINIKVNVGKPKSSRNDFKKIQSKGIETVKETEGVRSEKTVVESDDTTQTKQVPDVISQSVSTEDTKDKKIEVPSLVEVKIPTALDNKENSALNITPMVDDKLKLADAKKEPMFKSTLEFTADDVMPENAPNAGEAESHIQHSVSNSDALEHQLGLNTMYSKNKAETMKSAMLDYMAWTKVPSLNESYRLGGGIFTSVWEDEFAGDRIRAVIPGVQLGFKYNRHTENHLMRMFNVKLMTGYEFQNLRGKASAPVMDAPVDPMASDDAMSSDMASDISMNNSMPLKVANSLKLGSMLEYHYQLSPKSTLEIMNENWYSLRKADMAMDPKFSLIASHVYTDGDWNWRAGIGPQLEENGTWRLHVIPAEITYKNMATLGVFGNLYPFNKGEMYSDFSRSNLATIGVNLRFNIGANMHKGHEAKDHQQ